ncbi:hypothetical protein DFP72DRAFT_854246 [Ephemerocybe angulata]|uniref:Uncharacterized protein n=1 Tax=Ephemerocybe angulata TaxID=980116 RepID=A0A8H6HIL8_9AGAR|nr:hypothetical protein DFP72DRAFT_854246 [Tulosesus angulatus]
MSSNKRTAETSLDLDAKRSKPSDTALLELSVNPPPIAGARLQPPRDVNPYGRQLGSKHLNPGRMLRLQHPPLIQPQFQPRSAARSSIATGPSGTTQVLSSPIKASGPAVGVAVVEGSSSTSARTRPVRTCTRASDAVKATAGSSSQNQRPVASTSAQSASTVVKGGKISSAPKAPAASKKALLTVPTLPTSPSSNDNHLKGPEIVEVKQEDRKLNLAIDVELMFIHGTDTDVWCRPCNKRVSLECRGPWYPGNWKKHKKSDGHCASNLAWRKRKGHEVKKEDENQWKAVSVGMKVNSKMTDKVVHVYEVLALNAEDKLPNPNACAVDAAVAEDDSDEEEILEEEDFAVDVASHDVVQADAATREAETLETEDSEPEDSSLAKSIRGRLEEYANGASPGASGAIWLGATLDHAYLARRILEG